MVFIFTGRKTYLSEDQEELLKSFILYSAKIGYGLSKRDVPILVKDILDNAEKNAEQRGITFDEENRMFLNNTPSMN